MVLLDSVNGCKMEVRRRGRAVGLWYTEEEVVIGVVKVEIGIMLAKKCHGFEFLAFDFERSMELLE